MLGRGRRAAQDITAESGSTPKYARKRDAYDLSAQIAALRKAVCKCATLFASAYLARLFRLCSARTPEDSAKCLSLTISQLRGQTSNHEHKS
jgi:N-methylhydantoinase B/oxoprolinase/acetone carboxylase alpha subunit